MGRLTSVWNSFKGTKDSSNISMRKTVGLLFFFFAHIRKGFGHLPVPQHGHTAERDQAVTIWTDHCWSIPAITDQLCAPRPTSSGWNNSFGSVTRPYDLKRVWKKCSFQLEEHSSDQSCAGRGMKGPGWIGTSYIWVLRHLGKCSWTTVFIIVC